MTGNEAATVATRRGVKRRNRVFGVSRRLYCLDLADGLKTEWKAADSAFAVYGSAVTDGRRVLVLSLHGEMILFDAAAGEFDGVTRTKVFDGYRGVYAHPAFVGRRAYVRGSTQVVCVDLGS